MPVPAALSLLRNAAFVFGGHVLARLAGLVLLFYAARALGPEELGRYQVTLAIVFFAQVLPDFGLNRILVRDIARDPSRAATLVPQVLKGRLVLAVFAYAAAVATGAISADRAGETALLAIGGLALFPFVFGATYGGVLSAVERFRANAAASAFLMVGAVLGALAILRGLGVAGLLVAVVLGTAAHAAAVGRMGQRHVGEPPPSRPGDADVGLGPLFRRALPFAYVTMVTAVYLRADIVVIDAVHGERAAGLYAPARRLFDAGSLVVASLFAALVPPLARLHLRRDDAPALDAAYTQTIRLLLLAAVPIAVLGVLGAEPAMGVFGPEYRETAPALALLACALGFHFLQVGNTAIVVSSDADRPVAVGSTVSASLLQGLCFVLVPKHGPAGAALAALVCEAVSFVVYAWIVRVKLGVRAHVTAAVLPAALGATAMVAALFLLGGAALPVRAGAAFLAYAVSAAAGWAVVGSRART